MNSLTSTSTSCSSRTPSAFIAGEDPLSQVAGRSASAASSAVKFTAEIGLSQKSSDPLSDNPKDFFSNFNIDSSSFDSRDVQCLQRLFQTTKFNQIACLFDLIGLRIYDLIGKISSDWHPDGRQQAKEDWAAFYLQAFLCLLRENLKESFPYPDPSAQFFRFTPQSFSEAFERFITDIKMISEACNQKLSQQTPNNSKLLQAKKLEFLKKKTAPFLTELDELKTILQKSLKLENPPEVLTTYTLFRYFGSEYVNPTSQDEACQVLQNLCLYLEMLTIAQDANLKREWASIHNNFFSAILKELSPAKQSKNGEKIALHARKALNLIHEAILHMQQEEQKQDFEIILAKKGRLDHDSWCRANEVEKKTQKSPEKFLEFLLSRRMQSRLTLGWLLDSQRILEESIIVPLDASFYIPHGYLLRMIHNTQEILDDAVSIFKELNSDLPRPATTKIDHLLNDAKAYCMFSLNMYGFFEHLKDFYKKLQSNYGISFTDPSITENLIYLLKEFTTISLNLLLTLDPQECKTEPLSQQLLWLSRLFILCHDVEAVSRMNLEEGETEIFPESFLQFLALEENFLTEPDLPPSISIPETTSCESESSSSSQASSYPEDLEKLEEKSRSASPIQLQSAALKSVSKAKSNPPHQMPRSKKKKAGKKKVSGKEKVDSSSQSSAPAKKEISSQTETSIHKLSPLRDLLANRKRRHVEKILAHLGLQPIRTTGSHTIWGDPSDARKQTVVPHHAEIDLGTLKSIVNQLLAKGWSPSTA